MLEKKPLSGARRSGLYHPLHARVCVLRLVGWLSQNSHRHRRQLVDAPDERLTVPQRLAQRRRIAASQEMTFRAGLLGYDPYARVPQARVIVLG